MPVTFEAGVFSAGAIMASIQLSLALFPDEVLAFEIASIMISSMLSTTPLYVSASKPACVVLPLNTGPYTIITTPRRVSATFASGVISTPMYLARAVHTGELCSSTKSSPCSSLRSK